jgi:transcriptional regulator with XRE-family HTH domain
LITGIAIYSAVASALRGNPSSLADYTIGSISSSNGDGSSPECTWLSAGFRRGRFVIETRFGGRPWEVVVEPDEVEHLTALRRSMKKSGRHWQHDPVTAPTLGSRLRHLREALDMTQEEVSLRSVDEDGRILRRIEVGHVESGRNMASTRRVRASLARAFNVSEDDLFDYLEGRVTLAEFSKLRGRARRPALRTDERKSPREQAIELVLADGYGTPVEVRRAAARARETLPVDEQERLGVLEWAKRIEATLRQLRRAGDPAASSGVNPRARAQGASAHGAKGRRTA